MNARDRRRSDLLTLAVAVALLLAVAAAWWVLSLRSEQKRKEVLAGVPEFPQQGQVSKRRPDPAQPSAPLQARPKPVDAGVLQTAKRKIDRLDAFVLAPAHTVTLIQVNALFNTPLFARFRECALPEFAKLEDAAQKLGIDLEHDIDRVAMIPGGVAVSGFFEGKPMAEAFARKNQGEPDQRSYRDQTIWTSPNGACTVQLGNLVVMGRNGGCDSMVDRALDPPPDDANTDELYGDLYMRSDLTRLRDRVSGQPQSAQADAIGQVLESMSGMTVRANVWDDVALTLEGAPSKPDQLNELVQMAKGAMSVTKGQLGEDDERLQALAELAKVQSADGKLKLDVALPADQLFDRLHIPCPGHADAGP